MGTFLACCPVGDLAYGLGRGDEQLEFWGTAPVYFPPQPADEWPARPDHSFLRPLAKEVHVHRRVDGRLDALTLVPGVDAEVARRREGGFDSPDVVALKLFAFEGQTLLGVSIVLNERKFSFFRDALFRHYPALDVTIAIGGRFHGFRTSDRDAPNIVTAEAFLDGAPYIFVDDCSIEVSRSK